MAVDTVMVVTDTVDTVERDLPSHTMAMVDTVDTDMEAMVDTAMVDTVARDLLMPKPPLKPPQKLGTDTDMPDSHMPMVDTDTHMLMEDITILAKDLLNHLPTMVMDMAVVMDMEVTDMVDTVERDLLSHTTVMVDTDTEDTDMVVMAMDMVVKPYKKNLKASII